MNKIFKGTLFLTTLLILNGCATIMTGSSQPITINSDVPNSKVYVDGAYTGQTPLILDHLSTKTNHTFRIEAEGYTPVTEVLKREASGWVWGNLLLGGPIGLGIDFGTGGLYIFKKDNIHGHLVKIENLKPTKSI